MDVLLAPSHEEPFGRTLVEAMALGVPVLATNVGGPTEIIEDGREGHLLAPRDPAAWAAAVRQLAQEPERAAEMGRAGRIRAQSAFGVERHEAAVLGAYRRALGEAAPNGEPA